MTSKNKHIFRFFIFCCFLFTHAVYAVDSSNRFWSVAVLTGPVNCCSPVRYYLEPQIRFEDNQYKFNQFFFLTGLGYQINPKLVFYTGPGWVITKTNEGQLIHEFRFWQQANWDILKNLNSRTRLEERRNFDAPGLAWRLRERLWLRVPFPSCENLSLSLFDEVFFNLNHPEWVSNSFLEQNRAFLGIGTKITKSTIMDMGYLNQYLWSTTPQMNHVLLVSFTINL